MRIGNEGGYTKRRRPLLGLVCLLLTGCAQAGASGPDWRLGGPPEAYPRARFVSAVGEGESFEEARGRAKAELTRIFAVEVDSVVELTETETIEEGRRTRRSDFQDRTRARSSLELEGVETPLRWDDPETGRVSVLAVLDRGLECRRLGRDADGVEARFVRALARADEEEGAEPLLALQASHEALGAARTLEALAARSRVLLSLIHI